MTGKIEKPATHTSEALSGPKGESTSGAIVRDVVKGLYEGRYIPGQRLVEPDMMQEYGVSRSTVREAIKQLTADGIAKYVQFRGAHIRRLTASEAANIFSLTEVILGLAARQAALNISKPGAAEEIQACLDSICSQEGATDKFEFIRRRNRFFKKVVEISGNTELTSIIPKLQVHLIRNRLLVPASEREEGYKAVTSAILAGDGVAAEAATRKYVKKIGDFTIPYFETETGANRSRQGD